MEKYALITGGTKGIGKAVALCLGNSGYHLILTYASDSETATVVCRDLHNSGIKVEALQADVSKSESIDLISQYLISNGIGLDALILNAGMT